jgi:sulfite reductase alpha subunit-like flavoprotein
MTRTRTEKVLFLYGSQTGNSEQAAKDLCEQCSSKLSPRIIQKLTKTGNSNIVHVHPVHMQLDDFLELEHAAWTRLIVIVVSSYGVGAAPLGAYRFRELCDAWAEDATIAGNDKILDGVYFALCGLGDSKYTTFFQNPTKIDQVLQKVGAQRVGPLGKADASGTGTEAQLEVIERWMNGIWPYLAEVVAKEPLSTERLEEMQQTTVALCRKINPDYLPEVKSNSQTMLLIISVAIALLAVAAFFYVQAAK